MPLLEMDMAKLGQEEERRLSRPANSPARRDEVKSDKRDPGGMLTTVLRNVLLSHDREIVRAIHAGPAESGRNFRGRKLFEWVLDVRVGLVWLDMALLEAVCLERQACNGQHQRELNQCVHG